MDLSKIKALTLPYDKISNVIVCSVTASYPKSLLADGDAQNTETHLAIWDTGATNSAITELFAQKLGLKQTGVKDVSGLGGTIPKKTYLIDLVLPNGAVYLDLSITEIDNACDKDGVKIDNFGILIGMDIINTGDFSITNFEGKTVMSFRVPSCEKIDFVADWKRRKAIEEKYKGR